MFDFYTSSSMSPFCGEPGISITIDRGYVILNISALRTYGIKQGDYFIWGYDKKTNKIALKPAKKNEPGSRRISKNGYMYVYPFLRRHNITSPNNRIRAPLKKEGDLLVAQLSKRNTKHK